MNKTTKAAVIINSYAVAAATWSAVAAAIPVAGPLLGDTAGLTAITVAMTYSLAALFDKKLEEGAMWAFGMVVLGAVFGLSILRAVISIAPGAGSIANAAITFSIHQATGWGLYLIFDSGGELPTSKAELKAWQSKGKDYGRVFNEKYGQAMDRLPVAIKQQVEGLQKKLKDKSLSNEEKDGIVCIITEIMGPYRLPAIRGDGATRVG